MDAPRVRKISRVFSWGLCLVALLAVAGDARAQSATDLLPWQDDANLHDVQFIGSRVGYAVGDQGMVWNTVDTGVTWHPCPVPLPAMLKSVTFLTDRVGWVAGTLWHPFTRVAEGVVFATRDGGQTWEPRGRGQLPGVHYLRFFSPDEGVLVAGKSAQAPSGVYRTSDGGQTWTPLAGEQPHSWRTGLFFDPEMGLVAGRDGALSLVGGEQLLASNLPPIEGREIRGLSLTSDDRGWLVGDGGLVMTTASGGVSWSAPGGSLPDDVRSSCDFRTVCSLGAQVWIAGSPGSVIWNSVDAGQTWQPLGSGSPLPINKLVFVSESAGIAVGEMGLIRRTTDAGRTWQMIRGADRKAAWLALVPDPRDVTLEVPVKLSAEEGYRGVCWSASFTELARSSSDETDIRDRFAAAVHSTKANVGGSSWQLPLDRPDLKQMGEALMSRWQVRSEQRAPTVLVDELVRQIRTYQPDVVLLPYVEESDALASFILQAGEAAIAQASDTTRAVHHRELAGLSPWKVSRVFRQLAPGSRGDVTWQPDEFLPCQGDSLGNLTEPAISMLVDEARRQQSLAFQKTDDSTNGEPHVGGLFAGIDPTPGSPTRRSLLTRDEDSLNAQQKRLQAQRNFRAYSERALGHELTSAQLIGQLPDVLRELSVDQATLTMSNLAENYRRMSQFENAEATYLELVRRHPEHPAAIEAMSWLLTYWSSSEMSYQRLRGTGQMRGQSQVDVSALQQNIVQAGGPGGGFLAAPRTINDIIPTRATTTTSTVTPQRTETDGVPPDHAAAWRQRAVELATQMQVHSPLLFQRPEIQLPLAALSRANKAPGQADAIYRRFQQGTASGPVGELMERELWVSQPITLSPRHLAVSHYTRARPYLDGVLSDECWQESKETPIGPESDLEDGPTSGLVMFAHDEEFLYVAAVMKGIPDRSIVVTEPGDRDHDANLQGFDRLGIALDVDRDYVSWYELQVDERGQTVDRCWEDARWNPNWFVARDASTERWQLEIAIPWSELVSAPPQSRDVWALSVVRTIPHVGHHGWSQPANWPPSWESFGLLRFE